jgi:hypothetical protein
MRVQIVGRGERAIPSLGKEEEGVRKAAKPHPTPAPRRESHSPLLLSNTFSFKPIAMINVVGA